MVAKVARDLFWVGSSQKDFRAFPEKVRTNIMAALFQMVTKLGVHVVISCQPTMENEQGHVTLNLPQSA